MEYAIDTTQSHRPVIFLRHGTHRVMEVSVNSLNYVQDNYKTIPTPLIPVEQLKSLKLPDQRVTSFYHHDGWQRGYVKNSVKPLELLLMSWWTWDIFVGRDKEFGDSDDTGTVFYTSLKPWARKASDMWHFEQFLTYWGWRL